MKEGSSMVGKSCLWEDLFINKIILHTVSTVLLWMHLGYANPNTEGKLSIQYQNSLLSVDIQGAKLSDVIRELRHKTGVIFDYKQLPEQSIYLSFSNLSLQNGIKQVIPYGTIFISDQNSRGDETIKSVYILSSLGAINTKSQKKVSKEISSPIPTVKNIPQTGIEHLAWQAKDAAIAYQWLMLLLDKDSEKRLQAIKQLGKLSSNLFSVKGLYLSLNDSDSRVREAASENLKILDDYNRFQTISQELQQKNPIVQNHALEVIRLQKGTKWEELLIESIESNRLDKSLRETAEEILVTVQSQQNGN